MILGQKLAELLIVYPILGVCWLVGWLRSICRVFNGRLANDVPQSEVDTGHGCRKKLYVRLRWASLGSDLSLTPAKPRLFIIGKLGTSDHKRLVIGDLIEDSLELHLVGFRCGRLVCKLIVPTTLTRCFFQSSYF